MLTSCGWCTIATEPLRAVAGSIEITPARPLALAGYGDRVEPFEAVADPLELNGLLLRQGDVVALLLSIDVLFADRQLEAVAQRALERAGLSACSVLTAASHTHFAPNIDMTKPRLGACDAAYRELVESSVAALVDRLAHEDAVAVRLFHGARRTRHSVNRRSLVRHDGRTVVEMRANRRAPTDRSVSVVRLERSDGESVAVLWSYACHPVAFPLPLHVSADFPGVVRAGLRARHGHGCPVLFLQGFSGDVRPFVTQAPGRRLGRRLDAFRHGRYFGRFDESSFRAWAESLAAVALAAEAAAHEAVPALVHRAAVMPLEEIVEGDVGGRVLRADRLQLASELQLLAISAEVVTEYAARVRSIFRGMTTIPVGCAGDVFGYLPTERMLSEGGYEAGEFLPWFSLDGHFREEVETRTLRLLAELVV